MATVLTHHLSNHPDSIGLTTDPTSSHLTSVYDPASWNLDPRAIVEVVAEVLSPNSLITDLSRTTKDFSFDVAVPAGFERGTREVGDAMRGGLRVAMRNQTNLAPSVQPYVFRLACLNGMETRHDDLKFSARGLDLDEAPP